MMSSCTLVPLLVVGQIAVGAWPSIACYSGNVNWSCRLVCVEASRLKGCLVQRSEGQTLRIEGHGCLMGLGIVGDERWA